MLQVVKNFARSAPGAVAKANKLVSQATGGEHGSVLSLVSDKAPKLVPGAQTNNTFVAETLVRAGIKPEKLEEVIKQFAVQDTPEIVAHLRSQMAQSYEEVSRRQAPRPLVPGLSKGDADDLFMAQIKLCVTKLGLAGVDDLLLISAVLNSIQPEDAQAYKRKGAMFPALRFN